ncbi:LexA family protein [Comamonas testosteroni]|uniref:Peptidase S24 n=1 Tax=Comamonas testosteroni TaxID=285 RepID=A0A096F9P6_COMTE|nr:LexA family transcriptional regulator [Comamonas testosteroni]KGH27041.1 peptidase S24 [Comamonas testosteroni]
MIEYSERLKAAMDARSTSVSQLATGMGVSYQAVKRVLDGLSKAFSAANNTKASAYLRVSPDWLATGVGSMDATFDRNIRPIAAGMRAYPVISKIQAGRTKEMVCPYEPGDGFAVEFGENDASAWAFYFEIEGDSMLPEFREGDRVLIDPEVIPRPGDFVAARNSEQEATFKKYRVRGIDYAGKEIFELVPLNDDYPILRSDEHELSVIGTMLEHRRKFRRSK